MKHWLGSLKRWRAPLALLGFVFLGVFVYQHGWVSKILANVPSSYATPVEVETLTLTQQGTSEPDSQTISGYVIADRKIHISAKVSGNVVELPIVEGGQVSKGDLLLSIESQQYFADLKQAQASVKIAEARYAELQNGAPFEEIEQLRASLEQARARHDLGLKEAARAEQLRDTISPAELDKAKSNVREAEAYTKQLSFAVKLAENGARSEQLAAAAAEVERSKALLERAQYLFDCTRLVAPIDGTILQKNVELGEALRIDPVSGSTALCVLADLHNLQAEVDVQERDLPQVHIGQLCRVSPEADPENVYQARVERRSPVVNRSRGVVQVKVRILNPDEKLMPDMSCKVTFLTDSSEQSGKTLKVPRQAVIKESGVTSVFVLDGEVARRRVIKTGQTRDQLIEVASGLEVGDRVILSLQPLADGQTVHCRVH